MGTNRTKRTRNHTGLDYWKIQQLLTGDPGLAGVGYVPANNTSGCSHWTDDQWAEVHAAMRADWEKYGKAFMAWWRGETETFSAIYRSIGNRSREPEIEPWALREFGEAA